MGTVKFFKQTEMCVYVNDVCGESLSILHTYGAAKLTPESVDLTSFVSNFCYILKLCNMFIAYIVEIWQSYILFFRRTAERNRMNKYFRCLRLY